jgi:uncharacterized membrane protein
MTSVRPVASTTGLAHSAAYDLVLLAHVLTALIGLGAIVVAAGCALALSRSGPASEPLRRYYRPGVNWAGRVLVLVPVFGVALIAMSHGEWSFSDPWVGIGLVLWLVVAAVAELVLWPAERRLQEVVGAPSAGTDPRSLCLRLVAVAAVLALVLVAATVVMVAKP